MIDFHFDHKVTVIIDIDPIIYWYCFCPFANLKHQQTPPLYHLYSSPVYPLLVISLLICIAVYLPINMSQPTEDQKDSNFSYYHQYCRLYLANVVLLSQLRDSFNERNQLTSKFTRLEKKGQEILQGQRGEDDRKKRFRRTASEIERHYRCPVQTCQRSYGSEGSLNQHIKIKHPDVFQQLNLGRVGESGFDYQESRSSLPTGELKSGRDSLLASLQPQNSHLISNISSNSSGFCLPLIPKETTKRTKVTLKS